MKKNMSENENLNTKLPSELVSSSKRFSKTDLQKTKRRSGTKGEKGILFEKKVLMLILYQACEYGLDFILDTNVPEYGAFDDVIFICKDFDRCIHRIYGQLKHKESENKKITFNDLLKSSGDFSLYKYFIDYVKIFKKQENGKKYFVIYTNADFSSPGPDEKGYRINKRSEDERPMFKKLDTSTCKPLAVFDSVHLKNATNFNRKQKKNPSFYQFLDDTEDGLRETDRVKEIFKSTFLSIDKKEKKLLLSETELNNMLENFLKALVFATDQYDETTLGEIIKEKLRLSHPDYQVQYVYLYALNEIGLWKNRNAPPMTESNNYFRKGIENSKNFLALYPALKYENELCTSTIRFRRHIHENLKEFISSGKQLWYIDADAPWLNSLLIYQTLNQKKALRNYSKIDYSSHDHHILLTWNHLVEGHPFLLSLFENMKEAIIIIPCGSNDIKYTSMQEIVDKLANIVSETQKYLKQIILIAPNNHELVIELTAKLSLFSDKMEEIKFDHLTKKSQDDCLTKENVRFQGNGKLLSLRQLMRLEDGVCLSEEIQKLNLDALELEKIIKSDILEIGNDQPEFSKLESMHFKTHTLMKTEELKRAIATNFQDIFLFVGTDYNIKLILPENENFVTFEKWFDLSSVSGFHPLSKRFVCIKSGNKEDEQFKQLCYFIDQINFQEFKAEKEVLPTFHLLKEIKKEWIWTRTYSKDLYIHRYFHPLFVNKLKLIDLMLENSLLYPVTLNTGMKVLLKSRLIDYIIISEITPEAFFDSLNINNEEVQERIRKFLERATAKLNIESKTGLSKNSANIPNLENASFSLIFNDDKKTIFLDDGDAEEKFQEASNDTSDFTHLSVHWLKAVNDDGDIRFQWYRSESQIKKIRSILDDKRIKSMSEKCILENKAPLIVIADDPGMGKSTTLVSLAEMMKKSKSWLWVMKIDLNRHQEILAKTRMECVEDLIALLYTIDEKLTDSLTQKILRYKLIYTMDVVFLCDGFDEVKCERQDALLNIFRFIKSETTAKTFITTRPYFKEKLEEKLSVLVHSFQEINESQQIDFLSHFWVQTLKLTVETSNLHVLKEFAKKIIKKFRDRILDDKDTRSFISVPLRARMLAEVYRETIENALRGNDTDLNCIECKEKINIGNLYDLFIQRKYEIYFHEKIIVGEGFDEELEFLMSSYTRNYGNLALENIFGCKTAQLFNSYNENKFSFHKLSQIGLIQGNEVPFNFIHRTFAEYFAGKWLANACENPDVKKELSRVLFKKEYKVLRYFFDYFMSQGKPLLKSILEGNEAKFSELSIQNFSVTDGLGRTALHLAAQEGQVNMVDALQKRNMSLTTDNLSKTPLHYAASFNFDIKVVERTHVDALLENLIDIDLADHLLKYPLHFDIETGNSIFNNSICEESTLVEIVNKRDDEEKSALGYAVENSHWRTACVLLLYGANMSVLTKDQKKNLLCYAAGYMYHGLQVHSSNYPELRFRLPPVVGLLSIHVPESIQSFSDGYDYPKLLAYFFRHGHTKVIDSLMRSIQNSERRKRILSAKYNSASPLARLLENPEFFPTDEDYLKTVMYYDTQGREVLGMTVELEDIHKLLSVAAIRGFIKSFRYVIEIHAREQGVQSVFSPNFLYDVVKITIIINLFSNVQDLNHDDKWFQKLKIESSRLFGWNRLHLAATNKYIQSIEEFLDDPILDNLKTKDKYGYTPLLYACYRRGRSIFIDSLFTALKTRHLTDNDQLYEIIYTEDEVKGLTPLHWVICNGDVKSAEVLLEKLYYIGFDKKQLIRILTHRDDCGQTPMYFIRDEKITKLFMEYFKKFDFSQEEYISVLESCYMILHILIDYNTIAALALLIGIEDLPLTENQRAELVNKEWSGNTPLHVAAQAGYCYQVVLRLFRNGAVYNALNVLEQLPVNLMDSRYRETQESDQKTHFLLDSVRSLFELAEDQQISQNSLKLKKFKRIIRRIKGKSWIDPKSILNVRNRENQKLRDVSKDTVITNLLQEYEEYARNHEDTLLYDLEY